MKSRWFIVAFVMLAIFTLGAAALAPPAEAQAGAGGYWVTYHEDRLFNPCQGPAYDCYVITVTWPPIYA